MRYPKLKELDTSRQMVDTFRGYNHNLRISDGEFYDMQNMTSDYSPILAPRNNRGVYATSENLTGLIAKDNLCYVDGSKFVINGYPVEMNLSSEPKQLVSMGAYVIILPDKKWINTKCWTKQGQFDTENGIGNIEAEFTTDDKTSFTLCRLDGTAYEIGSDDESTGDENTSLMIDTSTEPHSLKQWSESAGMWVTIPTTYVKISHPNIGKAFEQYDGITISGLEETDASSLNGSAVVWEKGDDYIVVVGILDTVVDVDTPITISRTMPIMDFVIESGNRLFGCRYGPAANGEVVNEIYASKLGDFKNWNCFMQISTDSWVQGVGSDGPFTGAITHMGYPLFSKETCFHKVYGSYRDNFQIQTTACNGVQKGCDKSLAIVNTTLFYKSLNGICAYDGSLPTEVSYCLGNEAYTEAVGGAHGNKYYTSMKDVSGIYHLFVYDAAKGLWHKEDNLKAEAFCSCGGELYAIADGKLVTMLGSGTKDSAPVEWMVQTGEIGLSSPDMKYISRLTIRLSMEAGAELEISAKYDFSDAWENVYSFISSSLRSFSIPIRPKRCDHMTLRIQGKGQVKVYSITKTIEQGSELS